MGISDFTLVDGDLQIEAVSVHSSVAVKLMGELTKELALRYSDDGLGDWQDDDAAGPRAGFLIARWAERPAGCGAIRPYSEGAAEIKRMYVAAGFRKRGIGRRILAALELLARQTGYNTVRLETGTLQPEAIGLYEAAGYYRIGGYGFHRDDPRTVCFEKSLTSGD
jgi:GNAT superfamily N-acetyltransferase